MIDILIKLAFLGGSSADDVKRVSTELAQLVLSNGSIDSDEFNCITESMPIITNYTADYMGFNVAELRRHACNNKTSYSVIFEALLDKEKAINGEFDKFRKPLFYERIKQEYLFSLYRLACALKVESMTKTLKVSALNEMLEELCELISKESKSIIKDYIAKKE